MVVHILCMYILYIIESLFLSFVQKCTKVSVVVHKNISILSLMEVSDSSNIHKGGK